MFNFLKRFKAKYQLKKKFRVWKLEHLRPGEYINLAYFATVLNSGESDTAKHWGKRK